LAADRSLSENKRSACPGRRIFLRWYHSLVVTKHPFQLRIKGVMSKTCLTRVVVILAALLCWLSPVHLAIAAQDDSIKTKTQSLLDQWKPRLDEEKLHYLVSVPFVIAGDGTMQKLARYRDGTVLAAERALEATYFEKRPQEPIIIFLFESAGPYEKLAKKWFNDDQIPHFGFYRHADRVMFMNVATGTGTLVHELTHALIAPDFPQVPSWFNEGLASLYEQCSIDGNTITGHENWRLPALQKVIRDKKLRPLKELMDDPDFYGSELVGLNYAQARYLMFYLQQKKLLEAYYREFRDHVSDDPTGYHSLEKIVAPQSMADFEKQWQQWVLTLKFN
jgi:hypothetical protein